MITNNYSALMIDVVNSKKYENREEIQDYLISVMKFANRVFKKSLKKELMFSAGDEIQGLFVHPVAAYLCVRIIMLLSFPINLRASIGYGKISYENDEWKTTEMDGAAYHNARKGIQSFHGDSSFGILFNSDSKFDKMINSLIYAAQILQMKQNCIAHDIEFRS